MAEDADAIRIRLESCCDELIEILARGPENDQLAGLLGSIAYSAVQQIDIKGISEKQDVSYRINQIERVLRSHVAVLDAEARRSNSQILFLKRADRIYSRHYSYQSRTHTGFESFLKTNARILDF